MLSFLLKRSVSPCGELPMRYRGMRSVSPDTTFCAFRVLTARTQVIAFVELAERFSYYGTTVVFVSRG